MADMEIECGAVTCKQGDSLKGKEPTKDSQFSRTQHPRQMQKSYGSDTGVPTAFSATFVIRNIN